METTPDIASLALGRGGPTICKIANDRVTCATTLARQEPIYYCDREGEITIANRALIVAFLRSPGILPSLDLAALSSSFSNSYNSGGFLTWRTPFVGVNLAPPNALLTATVERLTVSDPGSDYEDFGFRSGEPDCNFYREIADRFVAGLQANVGATSDPLIGITGGKDSRLLAAALKAARISFRTITSGFDTDPDVIIGRRVAAFLGVPHRQNVPPRFESQFGSLLAIDARGETARELMLSDGMSFSVPNLPRFVSTAKAYHNIKFDPTPAATTIGAEIWRGGYASRDFSWFRPEMDLEDCTSEAISTILNDVWSRNAYFLKREYRAEQEKMVARWLTPCIERKRPAAAAERFYLEFEVGRRAAATASEGQTRWGYFQPFVDPEILRKIATLHPRFRRDHYIHYNVIKLLAPGLELLPFETKRWGFEWRSPIDEADREAWLARAPLPVTPQSYGAWPMYGAVGSDCWKRFDDELFCYADGENVWSFLDRASLQRAFRSDEIFTPQLSSLFWVIHGLSIMMAGDWLSPAEVPESLVFARYEKPWAEI
jgi:hypothetical protein